jgi:hypothetical protein
MESPKTLISVLTFFSRWIIKPPSSTLRFQNAGRSRAGYRRRMSDALFQEAYARARGRFTDDGWLALNPRQITDAIYQEIRQIDSERVARIKATSPAPESTHAASR